MNKLMEQIMKFGVVGFVCFFIDYIVLFAATEFLNIPYMISSMISFTVSVVINYVLSIKFVFKSKKDANKLKEFISFVILSLIGLGINQIIMWFGVEIVIGNGIEPLISGGSQKGIIYSLCRLIVRYDYMLVKIAATGIVMVYNFISRKIFLEEKQDN